MPVRLPIDDVLKDVVAALKAHPAVVVQAPPGAGKTTRLPLALKDAGLLGNGQLLLLEPRRIAARAAAHTMAKTLGQAVGQAVGYQVRFDSKESSATRILVVTEGILTRRFGSDPFLDGVSVVVLDEFHERSIHTDLCLALLKELLTVRDDLKVVVMSATLDAAAVAGFLNDCPVVTSAGRPYPVAITHAVKKPGDAERPLDDRLVGALRTLLAAKDDDGGDVLCFLPGTGEIRRAEERLAKETLPNCPQGVDVVPLYGALSPAEQDRALSRGTRRRIILATNVAETSLTIDGVTAVVDSGLMKHVRYDAKTDRERLELVRISQASAEQRAGRAGRTRPGRAVRLWTQGEHQSLPTSHAPEIHRAELAGVLLDVALFSGKDPRTFAFFEAPPKHHIDTGMRLLRMLHAVDDDGAVTAHGKRLAQLPTHPRTAAVLVKAAGLDVADDAALACAVLDDDRALQQLQVRGQAVRTHSDLQVLLERAGDDRRLREVHQAARDLARHAGRFAPRGAATTSTASLSPARALTHALLAGFPDRVCRRRKPGEPEALMVGGRGVRLAPESGVVDAPLFLALSLEGTDKNALVRIAEAVDDADLAAAFDDAVTVVDEAVFDDARGAFVGVRRTRFGDLVIAEKEGVPVSDDGIARGLAAAFAADFARLFRPEDDALRLRTRMQFAATALADVDEAWPAVDDDALAALLPELCATLVASGKRKIDDVVRLDWRKVLEGLMSHKQRRLLDDEIPARIVVPTGNGIAVDYDAALNDGGAPVLAVRLQELFGLLDTPRVARGRVGVVLHLLSPGYKPVQVTRDLKSFWANTYAEVKRELKVRYPKHSWPDDPLTAPPVAKGRSTRG